MKTILTLTFAVLAVCGIGLLSSGAQDDAAAAPAAPKKWQHLALPRDATLPMSDPDFAAKINGLGRDGWELVSVLNFAKEGSTTKTVYYFKKPL